MPKVHDELNAAIDRGDYGRAVAIALHARLEADKGNYCQCPSPHLVGADLMCGECGLENESQIPKAIERMREREAEKWAEFERQHGKEKADQAKAIVDRVVPPQ